MSRRLRLTLGGFVLLIYLCGAGPAPLVYAAKVRFADGHTDEVRTPGPMRDFYDARKMIENIYCGGNRTNCILEGPYPVR